jgi:nucleoside-diphosphate-sugar epimerase
MTTSIPLKAPIYIAGHGGLVGSAILRRLEREGFTNIITATREQLDLRDQAAVNYWFLDVTRLHQLGWNYRIDLKTGIEAVYRWYQSLDVGGTNHPLG